MNKEKRFLRAVGRKIMDTRIEAGMSQKDLALSSGINSSSIQRIELGQTNWTIGSIQKIMEALGLTIDQLIGDTGDEDEGSIADVVTRANVRVYSTSPGPRKT